jgi:hypothetical protein
VIVVFLQNPWSKVYAGGSWQRESWLRALHRSRSGVRLHVMTAESGRSDIWFDNVSPVTTATPSGISPPDLHHVRRVLRDQQPTHIVTCGEHARRAVAAVVAEPGYQDIPTLAIPHPANRVLTNALLREAGAMMKRGWQGRAMLVQERGGFVLADLVDAR